MTNRSVGGACFRNSCATLNEEFRAREKSGFNGLVARHELGFTPRRAQVEASRLRLMENLRNSNSLRFSVSYLATTWCNGGGGPLGGHGIEFFRVGNKWTRHYDGSYQPWFIMNFAESLEEFGMDAVRRCPRCEKIYIRTGRRLGCGDRCKAKSKAASLKQDPDNRMLRAFDAKRKSFTKSHDGREPSKEKVEEWWTDYTEKRKKKRKAISPLPWQTLHERCK